MRIRLAFALATLAGLIALGACSAARRSSATLGDMTAGPTTTHSAGESSERRVEARLQTMPPESQSSPHAAGSPRDGAPSSQPLAPPGSSAGEPGKPAPAAGGGDGSVVRPTGLSPAPAPPKPGSVPESPVPQTPPPEAILLVSGHAAGWITPCGCPGTRAGGVARRAGYGQLLRKTYPGVTVTYLDLGGFLSIDSDAQRITTDALLDAMHRIGYDSMNAAISDLGSSLEQNQYVASHLRIPRISANVVYHDTGKLAFPPYRVLRIPRPGNEGGEPIRIGLLGLVSDQRDLFAFGEHGRSLIALRVEETIERYLPELRAQSDLVVVLAETSPDPFYRILKRFKGIDLVVCGESSEILVEPIRVEGIPVTAIGTQGKYLAELRVHRTEGRLGIVPFVHWLDGRFPEDPGLALSTEEVLGSVNESSRRDVAADTSPAPAIAPYVGAAACASCHQREVEIWQGSKHARAFETLVGLKRDYTVTCVMCHVTGINSPLGGGFVNPRATPQLASVQCESCHGPAQEHLADPAAPYAKPPDDVCQNCHTQEQDPHFDRPTRWTTIAH